jgi:hypothetical protein
MTLSIPALGLTHRRASVTFSKNELNEYIKHFKWFRSPSDAEINSDGITFNMCHKTGKMIILIVNYIYIHIFTLK